MSSLVLSKIKGLLDNVPPTILTPLLVVAVVGILTWLYTRIARGRYNTKVYMKIPGPMTIPGLGNALDIAVPPHQFIGDK